MNKAGELKNLFLGWLAGWLIAWPAVCMADELAGWLNCRAASGLGIPSITQYTWYYSVYRGMSKLGRYLLSTQSKFLRSTVGSMQ